MNEPEQKTYFILRDLDGYGSEYPICVDRAEAERLVRAWDKEDFDEIWREATEEEIAKYGRYDTDTDAETLQELTGQESGIVIYDSGEMIVCNWSQLGSHELPKVFAGIEILGWEDEDDVFADADHAETNDFRPLLKGKNLIWDANGDIAAIENGTYFWGDDFRATVWTLTDGTIVVAPTMWN